MITRLSAVLLVLAAVSSPALAGTTFDHADKYAWGANTGWISFRHDQPSAPEGVVFGESFLSGLAYSANTGWISFGDGAPANGHTYSNAGSDHGVNHDGAGNLSGYAWSANTGWINFGWAGAADVNRPRVNLLTGAFSGYGYSGNMGWINLGTGLLTTATMYCEDGDGDGIGDHWEMAHFGDLTTATATSDHDADGVSDQDEYNADTQPDDAGSYLKVITQSYNLGYTEVQVEFTTSPTRLYRIEYSEDLGIADPWVDSSLGVFAPDAGSTTTKTVIFPTHTRKFFRAVVARPLAP